MEHGTTFHIKHNPPDSELSEWEVHVSPPSADGQDPTWEATIHDRGVFLEIPSLRLFLYLRWDYILRLTQHQGTHWDEPAPYLLTPEALTELRTPKGEDDDPR